MLVCVVHQNAYSLVSSVSCLSGRVSIVFYSVIVCDPDRIQENYVRFFVLNVIKHNITKVPIRTNVQLDYVKHRPVVVLV